MLVSNCGAVPTQQAHQSANAHAVTQSQAYRLLRCRPPGAIKLEGACRAHAAEHRRRR